MSDTMDRDKKQEQSQASGMTGQEVVPEQKKKHKKLWVWILVLTIVAGLAALGAAVYFYMKSYYETRFLPGTTVNGIVCDKLEAAEVAALLEAQPLTYNLVVTGHGGEVLGSLNEEDIGLRFVSTLEYVEHILENYQDPGYWPLAYVGRYESSHDLEYGTQYDEEMVLAVIEEWEALDEARMRKPENAYISEYQPEKGYEIVPETWGNTLDVEKVKELVLLAVKKHTPAAVETLNLEEEGCYLKPEVTSDNVGLKAKCEELNRMLKTRIVYDWNGSEVILDQETIHEWIQDENIVGPEGNYKAKLTLDEEAAAEFVAEQAKKYDTYGKHRKFTTALGETITVLNGGYGWKTDREKETEELLTLVKEGAEVEREPVYWVKGMKKGQDDIGSSYIEIDLSNQHLYVHWKGEIVLETDFVSGDMSNGNTTPGGLYRLTYKTTNAVLRGRDYVTPVTYWMPFNGNIGMHDATWRSEFGGDIFLTNGSHGCINLPLDKAQAIYGYVSTGFPIICYYY